MDIEVFLLGHPGHLCNFENKLIPRGRPGFHESLIQRQKCVGFAIVWQHVGRVISAQMHLKIKYGHGECF